MNFLLDKLFIEKVQKLNSNSFLKLCTRSSKFSYPPIQDPFNWPKINGISRLSIDSFVLHFRFLIQDRDNISNIKTFKRLLKDGLANPSTVELIASLENYKNTMIDIEIIGTMYTYYDLFETVFYGGLAHHNKKHLHNFINIANNPLGTGLALTSFQGCVKRMFAISKSLKKDINKYMKQSLENSK